MIPDIQAVFFDYGGTLDAGGVAWKEHFWPIYQKHGMDVDYPDFVRAFYSSDDLLVEQGDPDLSLTGIVRKQVALVLENLGINSPGAAEAIASDFCNSSFQAIRRNLPVLRQLSGRVRLGIISNNYGNLEAICKETGLYDLMSVMVDSRRVGAVKPDRRIFNAALDALNLPAGKCLMVGDSFERDIRGALNMGMRAVWLVPEKGITAAVEKAHDIDVPVITSIDELPLMLGLKQAGEAWAQPLHATQVIFK